MHIFLDESGTFAQSTLAHSISLMGALVIPDSRLDDVYKKYGRLRLTLRKEKNEVKGRLLDEESVARVIDLLIKNSVLFEATAIDMGIHSPEELAHHKAAQEKNITANLTDEHHADLVKGVWGLRERLARIPLQLYVQSIVTFEMIATVLRHSTLYFSQRIPSELKAFHWVADGKDKKQITDWEDWWSFVVMPALESRFAKDNFGQFIEGDYSHFSRFNAVISDYKAEKLGICSKENGTDIKKLMTESFRFSSEIEPGLELVNIVVNATRRALTGKLGRLGWHQIPKLMIHRKQHYIQIISLKSHDLPNIKYPYWSVLREFRTGGRSMLAPRFVHD